MNFLVNQNLCIWLAIFIYNKYKHLRDNKYNL